MHAWILSSELLLILLRQFLRHPPIHPMLQGGNRAKMRFGYNFWLGGPIDTRSMRLICILQDLFRDTPLVHIWPPWPNRIKAPGWWELHHLSSPIFVQHRHFPFPGWAVLFSQELQILSLIMININWYYESKTNMNIIIFVIFFSFSISLFYFHLKVLFFQYF